MTFQNSQPLIIRREVHTELPEDLLTVVSEGIARGLTRSGST